MAIKIYGPLTGLAPEVSSVRDNSKPQVNQELNTIDFTNLYLNREHFITK